MTQQEQCEKCLQRQNCQSVYKRLGGSKGPNVIGAAILAFIAPIVIFIIVLAISEKLLIQTIASEAKRTATAAGLALTGSCLCIGIVWVIRHLCRNSGGKRSRRVLDGDRN
ncbi:MAG: hypothetical protein JXA82_07450 [Sedimentisphaerales bacterium]|nr:hypothetical protein [Sedimentisphaerales bacterium]